MGLKLVRENLIWEEIKKKILVMLLFCNVFFYLIIEESFCYCDCKYWGLLVLFNSFIMINSFILECIMFWLEIWCFVLLVWLMFFLFW